MTGISPGRQAQMQAMLSSRTVQRAGRELDQVTSGVWPLISWARRITLITVSLQKDQSTLRTPGSKV